MGFKVYDFQCREGHVFEELVKDLDDYPAKCPRCGDVKIERLLCAPRIATICIPDYPGSKRLKAGYQHTHNRPAENSAKQSFVPSSYKK